MSVLQVFKSLPVVHEVVREGALPASATGYARETVTLGWEERLKARGRRRSDGGTEFAWDEELRFPWWMGGAVGGVAGAPVLKRVWEGNLRRLKAKLERT